MTLYAQHIYPGTENNRRKACCSPIPFHLSSLMINGTVNEVGSYHSRTDKSKCLPLTIIIVCHGVEIVILNSS